MRPTQAAYRPALERCARRWRLTIGEPLTGGLVAHVVACRDARGEDLVLKLMAPDAGGELEAAALRHWHGRRVAMLVDDDPREGALLLRRERPGTPLGPGDQQRAMSEVAAVVSSLHGAPAWASVFPSLGDRLAAYFDRTCAAANPSAAEVLALVPEALAAAGRLIAEGGTPVLLHGDLMDKNLLWGKSGLVAVDPMPMVGDAHSDLGFWAATHPPVGGLRRRAGELARRTGREPERAARWAAVWAVGHACDGPPGHAGTLRVWLRSREARSLLDAGTATGGT